jgi:hypothetical protein
MPSGSKSFFAGASHIRAVMWWLVNGAYRIVRTAIRRHRHRLITVFVHDCLLPRSRMHYPGYFKTRLICGSFSPAFAPPRMMPLFASATRRHASARATDSGPVSLQRPAEMPPPSICRPINGNSLLIDRSRIPRLEGGEIYFARLVSSPGAPAMSLEEISRRG